MSVETYRCLYCKVSLDGPDAWIEHINTREHRQALLGPALQQDPDGDLSLLVLLGPALQQDPDEDGYVGSLRPLFEHPDEENLSQREQELANEPEYPVPHRQHDND